MDRSETLRTFFAAFVARRGGAGDPRVEAAFAAVPREPFAGPAPWLIRTVSHWPQPDGAPRYLATPDDDPAFLYQDVLVALDPDKGINIGEPSLHARCLDALAPRAGETVLHVGAGSGYYTALLAHLVGARGRVHAFEVEPALAARARANLAALGRTLPALAPVVVEARSGIAPDLPRADAIYVSAGLTRPEPAWLDALAPGGRLMLPLQPARFAPGGMLRVERPADPAGPWPARIVSRARFIGCRASADARAGAGLAEAFAGDGGAGVRSLRRGGEPDATAWVAGEGWWLSTTQA